MEIVGREVESSELADVLRRSADVLGDSFGGFTFSGGEPLMQSDFILEVIAYLSGYHFCIETSGYASANVFSKILDKIDYVIMDLKLADDSMHKQFTGVSNERILKNFDTLRKSGKECCIRTPLIPSITDTEKNLSEIKALVGDIHHELLPYNPIGAAKYKMLNMSYPMNEFIVN
jgi:pyruvate formate lyase activating enzyme